MSEYDSAVVFYLMLFAYVIAMQGLNVLFGGAMGLPLAGAKSSQLGVRQSLGTDWVRDNC